MATLIVGGNQVDIPVLNFKKLREVWPHLQKAANVDPNDPLASIEEAIIIIEVALRGTATPMTKDEIEEKLQGPEVRALEGVMFEIMSESGLIKVGKDGEIEGNAPGAESPEPSTEILTPSSLNSSQQDVKEEVGTG